MFRKKSSQAQSTAAIPTGIPRPMPGQTVHHHAAPSEAGKIFVTGLLIIVGAIILWYVVLYVLEEMRFKNPVASLGWGVFYILVILAIVWLPAKALEKVVGMGLATLKEIKQDNNETKIQLQRLQLQLAQAAPVGTTRTLDADSRKADIVQVIMALAYQFIEDNGRNFAHNDAKPWTWSTAKGMEVRGKPITEAEARQIKYWLQEMGFVDGHQVNLGEYPDMNSVNKYLRANFELPIIYGGALPSSTQNGSYPYINEDSRG